MIPIKDNWLHYENKFISILLKSIDNNQCFKNYQDFFRSTQYKKWTKITLS